jgi:hypothetical protein
MTLYLGAPPKRPRPRRWRNCLTKRQQEQVLRHPAVESLHFEEQGDGPEYVRDVWIYLKPGFICRDMECGTIHEYDWPSVKSMMASIEPTTEGDE